MHFSNIPRKEKCMENLGVSLKVWTFASCLFPPWCAWMAQWPPHPLLLPFIPIPRYYHSTLDTVQETLYTVQETLYTVHSTLYTKHSTIYTVQETLYTVQESLYYVHSTLYTVHSTLYTLHSTIYTVHSTIYTVLETLYTVQESLYNAPSTLYTVHSTLYTVHSTLNTLHWTLNTLHCTLNTLHCTLNTQHSSLYTQQSTLYTQHFTLCRQTLLCLIYGIKQIAQSNWRVYWKARSGSLSFDYCPSAKRCGLLGSERVSLQGSATTARGQMRRVLPAACDELTKPITFQECITHSTL